jgi:hypothetical protein
MRPETQLKLMPPADGAFSVPKEEPMSPDYPERNYECKNGHRNTIYDRSCLLTLGQDHTGIRNDKNS